ncbi:MAG: sel1 repeat family protein [Alphaproteobacteria bacterium]|nr:sel1 repeat family protein [Alphaproteobacteria bacterium]
MKKNNQLNRFIFLLLILSVIGVFYASFKDFFIAHDKQFEIALKSDGSGKYQKAERYYLLASKSEVGELKRISFYYLGMLYKKKDVGSLKNYKKSEQYLEKSAQLGLKQAQYELALLYHAGDKIPENMTKALSYMKMAVDQNFAPAEYVWGVWLERGYMGKVSQQEALSFYEKSANQGYMPAIKGLALVYKIGSQEIMPDTQKAQYWYEKISK